MNSTIESFMHLKRLFPADFTTSLSEESFLYRLLVEQRPEADVWRRHIDDCLELAYRYNLVDADLEARLKKGDWESWEATINELKVAKFIESIFGINSLHWHPQGRKGKVGEFEVISNNLDKPIFVEVKTVFPRELEKLEEHIIDKLRRFTKQVPLLFVLDIHIKEAGESENLSGRKFKDFLNEELAKINVEDIKEEPLKLPDYRDDKTGLHLEVKALPIFPRPTRKSCYVGIIGGEAKFVSNEVYIHHSLNKAYAQLPKRKQACLVILCSSTEFPIDEDDMLNVLLGTLSYRIRRYSNGSMGKPEPFRKLNGFPHPQHNRKLSAIGLYREKFIEKGIERNLEIYHNPFAVNPLDQFVFKGHGIRQLVRVSDEMDWSD